MDEPRSNNALVNFVWCFFKNLVPFRKVVADFWSGKIFRDTLQSPGGKYSRKSLSAFIFLFLAAAMLVIGVIQAVLPIVVSEAFLEFGIGACFTFAAAALGMTVYDKKKPNKIDTDERI